MKIRITKTGFSIGIFIFFLVLSLNNSNSTIIIIEGDNETINSSQSSPLCNKWLLTWGGSDYDSGTDVLIDGSNNIYFAGRIGNDYFVVKVDPFGNELWNIREVGIAEGVNSPEAELAFDYYGNLFLATTTKIDTKTYLYLAKFSSSGQKEWNVIWGSDKVNEYCKDLIVDINRNLVYIAGSSSIFGWEELGSEALLVRFNTDGIYRWNRTWGGFGEQECTSLYYDSSSNIYIAGNTFSTAKKTDMFLVKYTFNGYFKWSRKWGGNEYDYCQGIVIDSSNNIFLGGNTRSFGLDDHDFCIIKYDTNGNLLWNQTRPRSGFESCQAIALDSNNNILLAGYTYYATPGDFYLVQFSDTGIFQWDFLWGGSNTDRCFALGIDEFDNIYMGGNTASWGIPSIDMFLAKFGEAPKLTIINPSPDEVFGLESPNFEISIDDADFPNTTYYTLNNGPNNYFSGLSGQINQNAWNQLTEGRVNLKFYASDIYGVTISEEISVFKDSNIIHLEERNAYAIVIGIENYPGSDNDLDYCRDDANSIYAALLDEYKFRSENIHLFLDSQATYSGIVNAFSNIGQKINYDDIFLFYYSGHGGGPYYDENSQYLVFYDNNFYDYELETLLDGLNCEQYILIDSCLSGGFIFEGQANRRYFMTACARYEDSWESYELDHGVFTNYYLESTDHATDNNEDGIMSMEEQFDYTYPRVVSYIGGLGEVQNPQEYDGISGESVLYPAIGPVSLILQNTRIIYNFNLYGHGTIQTLELSTCRVDEYAIVVNNEDLKIHRPTTTGFGYYDNYIEYGGHVDLTGYRFKAEIIDGYGNTITYEIIYGDTDGDGLYDLDEIENGLDPSLNDTDSDGLDDYIEFFGDTNPILYDTDFDGMPDGFEVFNDLQPLFDDSGLDPDQDGLSNLEECNYDTDPHLKDTDGDSWSDGDEISRGTDPLDPNDYPQSIPGYYLFTLLTVIIIGICAYIRKKRIDWFNTTSKK